MQPEEKEVECEVEEKEEGGERRAKGRGRRADCGEGGWAGGVRERCCENEKQSSGGFRGQVAVLRAVQKRVGKAEVVQQPEYGRMSAGASV